MGIQNSRALGSGHPGPVAHSAGSAAQQVLQSINIHGLSGVHVPAGQVEIPTGTHAVGNYYLMNPVSKGLVREWARVDGKKPFVRFAMETAKSPHNPGQLHVVQRGSDARNMELIPEAEMIADYDLDAGQGHLELVGAPIRVLMESAYVPPHPNNVMTWPLMVKGHPDDVMQDLNFFEQVALVAFLNRVTIGARAAAHLGAFMMVSEAQIVHAANYPKLFEGSKNRPTGYWTRDLLDSKQLNLPATHRIDVSRVWRGALNSNVGLLPVVDRQHNNCNLYNHCNFNVARFAVLPAGSI